MYLSHEVKVQTDPPGESANCHLLNANEVDWHIYLTNQPDQAIEDAIVVETTPRVRPNHKWTTEMLAPYVSKNRQVRVSGWLLYDFEHLDVVGKDRATVWEVHPIIRIEVQDANWMNIEHRSPRENQSHNRTVFCFEQAKRAIPQDTRKRNSLRGALVGTIICGQDRRRKVTVRVDGIYRGHNESWLLRRCGNSAYVETDVDDRRGLALTQTVPEAYAAGR